MTLESYIMHKTKLKKILLLTSIALFVLFLFSLDSDVWEAYATLFAISLIVNIYYLRKTKKSNND